MVLIRANEDHFERFILLFFVFLPGSACACPGVFIYPVTKVVKIVELVGCLI